MSGIRKIVLGDLRNWRFWILLAVVFKAALFILQITQHRPAYVDGFIGNITGDVYSYLDPVDNLIENGSYSPDYRLPGYGVFYFVLRLMFQKALACNILIIIQVLVSAVSVYALALTAKLCFRSDVMFYMVYYTYCISSYTNLFDSFILTDSFSTSASVFAVYFFVRFREYRNRKDLLYSGAFVAWLIFLRPMFAPFPMIFLMFPLIETIRCKNGFRPLIRNAFIFVLPLILVECAWMTRNYILYKRMIPLTTSLYPKDFEDSHLVDLMNFVKSWGGDRTWWNSGSEMRWFGEGNSLSFANENIIIPDYIYTSQFSLDSLLMIKQYVNIIDNPNTSAEDKRKYTLLVKNKLPRYTASVEKEKPFLFYVKGPLILFKRFFFNSGTYNLFHKPYAQLNLIEWPVKVFYTLLYGLTLVFGVGGLILMLIKDRKNMDAMLIVTMVLYSMILFPFVLRQIEYRYFLPAFPFMIVSACYFVFNIYRRFTPGTSKY